METYREHRKYFEEFYIDTPFFDAFTPERAATETDNLKKLCGFKKDDTILDTGCGHGRHCIRLKDDGFSVFGLDYSPKLLKIARTDSTKSGIQVPYVRGDMRHLPFRDSSFSWALSIFGSFGWLGDEDNLEVLKETGRVLKKDGKALLDIWSEEYFARLTDDVIRRDMKGGGYLIQKLKYNPNQKRLLVTRTIASGDRERTGSVSLRLYSVSEMKGILEALGFKIANIVDNHLSGNGGEKITATVMICEKS